MSVFTRLYLSVSLEPNNYNLNNLQSLIKSVLIGVMIGTSLLIIILIWSLFKSFSTTRRRHAGKHSSRR